MSASTTAILERLSFVYQPKTRIVSGIDVVEGIGSLAREFSGGSVLLVTDPGLVAAGHADRVQKLLSVAGLRVARFDRVQENPTTECVTSCLQAARAATTDLFIALGGGSAMDTAKGCNFLLTNGGEIRDYWGVGKVNRPMLPLIAIPTTAGTGSEMQSAALIADAVSHQKMACLDPKAIAKVSILDPVLTISQPPRVTACTGIDAIAHAVETAVTRSRNAISLMYSHEAFKLAVTAFPEVLRQPRNLEARGHMLLAAALAGTAIENSMLGAAHAAANPLTAHYNIVHGMAVGLMLPHVVRFNARDEATRLAYAEIASAPEIACVSDGVGAAVEALIERLERLLDLAAMPRSLAEAGVPAAAIPVLAAEASRQWTAGFNPSPVAEADFAALYQAAFQARRQHPAQTHE